MSGINPVQGGPDRSTLSSTVQAKKDSPTDKAATKHAADVKKAKLVLAKRLKLAAAAKREAKAAEAKAAAAKTATAGPAAAGNAVDVYA